MENGAGRTDQPAPPLSFRASNETSETSSVTQRVETFDFRQRYVMQDFRMTL
ncbi:hypothetical protein RD1_2170 [Roseobacter denitrificans OCh 114]|uniref:Uncharacterized protein n=1 Tax=Roseobacter denitrificans (strain ATCC 33942 / OCh 114) TaxID=375451 RepID=Q167S8_ROSDO|nr:hypothetical protein RD1_2170 [Roseobacter denitrificans OCh 114]